MLVGSRLRGRLRHRRPARSGLDGPGLCSGPTTAHVAANAALEGGAARSAIAAGPRGARIVAGASGFYAQRRLGRVVEGARATASPTARSAPLLVAAGSPATIWVVAGGRLWRRAEGADAWSPSDAGMPEGRVDTVASDAGDPAPALGGRARISSTGATTEGGPGRRPVGPFAESNTSVRGIAVARRAVDDRAHDAPRALSQRRRRPDLAARRGRAADPPRSGTARPRSGRSGHALRRLRPHALRRDLADGRRRVERCSAASTR